MPKRKSFGDKPNSPDKVKTIERSRTVAGAEASHFTLSLMGLGKDTSGKGSQKISEEPSSADAHHHHRSEPPAADWKNTNIFQTSLGESKTSTDYELPQFGATSTAGKETSLNAVSSQDLPPA
jgi:hypothetical protein